MTKNLFGENLKKLREKNHLSRKELADKLGLSEQAIHYYETGKRETNFATLIKIAELFDVPIDLFLRGNVEDFDKDNSVKLNLTDEKITFDVPADRRDLLLSVLPYAGKVINSVMSAVEEAEKSRRNVEMKYIFSLADAQNI